MVCHGSPTLAADLAPPRPAPAEPPVDEPPPDVAAYVRREDGGLSGLHLMVEGVHCGACVRRIEGALRSFGFVDRARLNLTTRRLAVAWRGAPELGRELVAAVTRLGYRVVPFDPERLRAADARDQADLLRALAVAGFAAAPVRYAFVDVPRPDAAVVVAALRARGLAVELLSGDRAPVVERIAGDLGIEDWRAARTPAEKCDRLAELAAAGRRVLMVGDGLNDAAALAAAHVSLSPSTAADISQTAAAAVFQGERLAPVLDALDVARRADRLVRQNFALAFGYNALTVPLAVLGFVTPLIAAICMSASSVLVVGNALRLDRGGGMGAARR